MHPKSRTSEQNSELAFGPFTLDLRDGELRRNGLRLRLQPQTRRLLLYLASRAGQVVTRHELRTSLWEPDACVDFEHALNFCICQLRAALRDPANRPKYIETLPKRGYRFIAATHRLQPMEREEMGRAAHQIEKTIAVLPYRHSGDSHPSLAEGMTDCLITMLSKVPGLRVIPAASVMNFSGSGPLVQQLAFNLDANWVVDGRILVAGKQVRISSQLVDAPLGSVLWSEQHEDHLRNILYLQSACSQEVAYAVSSRMPLSDGKPGAPARQAV